MHIFFSGIGGTAIGPLAMIAKQAGYEVSGSDKQASLYIDYLQKHGIKNIYIGQDSAQIAAVHSKQPIDWYVYSSAVEKENPNAPELEFVREQDIKISKRDELINHILKEKHLEMLAVAGTHGKTTTTAMIIWLLKQLGEPVSYSVGAKISFGDMGEFDPKSEYFVYEADEFDRNFLAFEPYISVITGVSWDHHEIFPTRKDYQQAFKEFISQSKYSILWRDDADYLALEPSSSLSIHDPQILQNKHYDIQLFGQYNRLDAWLAIQALQEITYPPIEKLIKLINEFPGLQRRMEEIIPNLYSDYAHTPEKIRGAMSVALEIFEQRERSDLSQKPKTSPVKNQPNPFVRGQTFHKNSGSSGVVVVYEPLTNRRQHHMIDDYGDCFAGAKKVYWIPSYLAREDPAQRIIPPEELISHLSDPSIAEAKERDENLRKTISAHLEKGDMVVAMAGGGGGSLDEWVREKFTKA